MTEATVPAKTLTASLISSLYLGLSAAHADASFTDCRAHFVSEGSFLAGKKFSTWVELSDTTKPDAYSHAYAAVAKDGFQIVSSDKEAGILSASQAISFGKGATAPLVIVVEPSASGSKLTATFRIGAGQVAKADAIRDKLCEYLGAAPAS
jgi:hypothetical protein